MKQERLRLYQIDLKYIRDLAQKDDNVHSISPQIDKDTRPFVGIVIVCEDKEYCIPLSSPKPKHNIMNNDIDFSKIIVDGKLIGVLNFNNMIPVDKSVLIPLNIKVNPYDTPSEKYYKGLARKQLNWCQQNEASIISKANKLYKMVTITPEKSRNLTRRCCDFLKLEQVLKKHLS